MCLLYHQIPSQRMQAQGQCYGGRGSRLPCWTSESVDSRGSVSTTSTVRVGTVETKRRCRHPSGAAACGCGVWAYGPRAPLCRPSDQRDRSRAMVKKPCDRMALEHKGWTFAAPRFPKPERSTVWSDMITPDDWSKWCYSEIRLVDNQKIRTIEWSSSTGRPIDEIDEPPWRRCGILPSLAMLLQLTRSLYHADPRLEGLEHVLLEVNELLDVSLAYTLPQAAASGCLPVFDRVANRVLQSGTDALVVMNLFGRAMEAAIHSKNMTMIKRIHQLFPAPLAVSSIRMAIESDNLELVQWMLAHRFDKTCWNKPPSELEDRRRCACCMKGLGVAGCAVRSWLHDEGYVAVDSWIGKRAALDGDLRTIEWLHQRQMPHQMLEDAFQPAIDHGHLHIVKFLHENGYTTHLRTITMTSGMVCDFPDLFAYLHDEMDMDVVVQAPPPGLGACCRKNAWLTLSMAQKLGVCITHGHLEALQWLTASNQRLIQDSDFVLCATDAGQLDVLKWLREQGAQFPMARVLSTAASRGHLHIIKWLHELQPRGWTSQLMDLAASNGHLDVVEFLDEHRTEGCTTAAMDGAAQIGRLDIVQWLHMHRSEGCTTRAMDQAASGGHLNIVQWLHTNRTEGCTTNALDSAAGWGHLDVVWWLHANRKEGCTTKAMDHAASLGFLDVVSWLHEHRREGCTPHAMSNSPWDVAQWLRVHRGLGGSLEQTIRALGDGDVRLVEFLRTIQDAPEHNNDDRLRLATRSAGRTHIGIAE